MARTYVTSFLVRMEPAMKERLDAAIPASERSALVRRLLTDYLDAAEAKGDAAAAA